MPKLLNDEQVLVLREAHKKIRDKRLADRIKAVLSLNEGFRYEDIAKILLLDEVTLNRYIKKFKAKGISGLLEMKYKGGQTKLNLLQESELKKYLEINTKRTVKEIVNYIEAKYKIKFSTIGATKLLHRLGFSYKKPKVVPGKADFFNQALFIEKYDGIKNNLKPNDQIYFVDSTHPEHNTKPSYGWILKGKKNDKVIKTNTGRERLNLAGALNLNSKEAIVLSEETINKKVTIKLIKKLQKIQPHGKIYMILDNASYYHANLVKDYVKRKRVKLIFLPSYSPNLNIIERLWKFFHQKITYNHYFSEFKQFKKETLKFFRNIKQYKPELDTLLTDNFQLLPT
jgi:transposase